MLVLLPVAGVVEEPTTAVNVFVAAGAGLDARFRFAMIPTVLG